jgi:agmatinase
MAGRHTGFCGLPRNSVDYSRAFAVILPVPFDKTSTWLKGADKGPEAIIEASGYLEFYDIETGSEVLGKGIYTAEPILATTSSALIKKTATRVAGYLKDKKLVVTLGGEHSVSIGVIKSFAEKFKDLSILHLDAHSRISAYCILTPMPIPATPMRGAGIIMPAS